MTFQKAALAPTDRTFSSCTFTKCSMKAIGILLLFYHDEFQNIAEFRNRTLLPLPKHSQIAHSKLATKAEGMTVRAAAFQVTI